ncbi:cation diffusion facilitator family transporter [Saccharospirillum sp.]|uniref:cation diffusion facilitator family transporter n=1 Tax=Saccharospirillum sp. TaxID=2033801 RepID=UPI00349FF513
MNATNDQPILSREARKKVIDRTNWICVAVDAIAFVIKIVVGVSVKSPALIADAMHSLSDLAADVPLIILAKVSHHDADAEHPYGHARFETLGTVMLGGLLLAVAAGIAYESIQLFFADTRPEPSLAALITIIIALALKEGLFHYAIRQSRRARSPLLEANAWHARSDSMSSLVVLVGVIATLLGYPTVEIIAAVIVAGLIGHMGITLTWNALQELVDRGVDRKQQQAYLDVLASVPGVKDVHMLRTRMMGPSVFIDAHIQVGGYLSVSEGHQINEWALRSIKEKFSDVTDVTLHIDHEKDLDGDVPTHLAPLRPAIENLLFERGIRDYDRLNIHYHRQKATLEVFLLPGHNIDGWRNQCDAIVQEVPWIDAIYLSTTLHTSRAPD